MGKPKGPRKGKTEPHKKGKETGKIHPNQERHGKANLRRQAQQEREKSARTNPREGGGRREQRSHPNKARRQRRNTQREKKKQGEISNQSKG